MRNQSRQRQDYRGQCLTYLCLKECLVHIIIQFNGWLNICTYAQIKANDVADWKQKMIDVGVIHHGVLIHDSKVANALAMFCKFMNIEAVRGK